MVVKDTLLDDCDDSDTCTRNCCVNSLITPIFFVGFVLLAQFILINVVVAVLMKHLEVCIDVRQRFLLIVIIMQLKLDNLHGSDSFNFHIAT